MGKTLKPNQMTKEYRTLEQFHEVVTNSINGNWIHSARACIEYGFSAVELIDFNEQAKDGYMTFIDEYGDVVTVPAFDKDTDIAILIELKAKLK